MDITVDLKICEEILNQYKKLTSEDGQGAFKLSQLSLAMYDRLNEIRINVNKVSLGEKQTKTDLKEYLRSKMKVMECIHVESRVIFTSSNNDSSKFKRY
ncbi:hypothetical protein SAMN05444401_3577 [Clostridium amylolyticum]|uniref:Uncharacterized protein n=1 Tax=Clostridium amylolyticum TaxID=1121298 RepID=A0A1M6L1W4_9CLOT|nr:hypothetical protein [Clostridium amylolyticum]SHJ65187.1 hypothetical protein SAMN05444401_3577 [Clostridium amylolyticum]